MVDLAYPNTDPKFESYQRGACKECKIQCKPIEEACLGIDKLEAGFWYKTGKKGRLAKREKSKNIRHNVVQ